jgi:hypothetical protein
VTQLPPGTVIVTATPDPVGWAIRLRSKLMGRPALHNHVALLTHYDTTGRPRGLEGRPSGFGWANLDTYLGRADTLTNAEQPLTDEQRSEVIRRAVLLVGIPYDWAAILAFAAGTAGIRFVAEEWPDNGVPSHVVCSSAIDYLYEGVGAANPGGFRKTRGTDPSDWTEFIQRPGWAVPATTT